ncbi:NAD(P)-binding protein [Massarina eburnea CBS 473.64]|uniref:NAD(P)-binding protein n=1 Tax=Massarina eburnea CBS 473.64 TaxID=1395130 RepID=A0A6A6RU80_9PLEO|nr:NAD(P)-binding protein [Massarina eburnea CBS 473.64]
MTKVFITGATGYIGGDALYVIANTYPDLAITALVRNSDKGAKIAAQYTKIKLVYGNLDNADILTEETAKADITLHFADSDHVAGANAIVAGLAQKQTPGYLIHTSGTGILGGADWDNKTFGTLSEKVYDDWDGLGEVTSFPDHWSHRDIDKIVLAASSKNPGNVFTAIVTPPTIYGPGRGPDNQRSHQVPELTKNTLSRGKGFHVGDGKNVWHEVHVQDLSNVYLALVTAARQPGGGKATWNDEGYYFAESGEFVWGDISKAIAKAAADRKLIASTELDSVSAEEADKFTRKGSYIWGTNSRGKAIRARKLLGWEPKQKSLVDTIEDLVVREAKALGLAKTHQEVASG